MSVRRRLMTAQGLVRCLAEWVPLHTEVCPLYSAAYCGLSGDVCRYVIPNSCVVAGHSSSCPSDVFIAINPAYFRAFPSSCALLSTSLNPLQ